MSQDPRNRWGVVVAYTALGAVTQVPWLTIAPITTATAEPYGGLPFAWRLWPPRGALVLDGAR